MKRAMTWVAASLLMLSCSTKENSHKCINTLPAGISIEELTDCTVPAKFTTDDFNWMGGNLTMTVYITKTCTMELTFSRCKWATH